MHVLNPIKYSKHFPFAFAYALQNEGGFVHDPFDPGGATKFGVTQLTLSRWRKTPVSFEEVKTLTENEAADIYHEKYWKLLNCQYVENKAIAAAIFDASILFGPGTSASFAQKAINACGHKVKIDRSIGRETIKALNQVNVNQFIKEFHKLLLARIENVIHIRNSSEKFRKGWQTRVNRLFELCHI